ncbi:MAG: hypothetical protein ACI9W2_005207, partial [Gammaproteobacteria bacterium]
LPVYLPGIDTAPLALVLLLLRFRLSFASVTVDNSDEDHRAPQGPVRCLHLGRTEPQCPDTAESGAKPGNRKAAHRAAHEAFGI